MTEHGPQMVCGGFLCCAREFPVCPVSLVSTLVSSVEPLLLSSLSTEESVRLLLTQSREKLLMGQKWIMFVENQVKRVGICALFSVGLIHRERDSTHVNGHRYVCCATQRPLRCTPLVGSRFTRAICEPWTVQSSTATETEAGYAAKNMFIMPTKNSQLANTCEHFGSRTKLFLVMKLNFKLHALDLR